MTKRLAIGSRVQITVDSREYEDNPAHYEGVVIAHGRDAGGCYTRIRHDDGTTAEWHRSALLPLRCLEVERDYSATGGGKCERHCTLRPGHEGAHVFGSWNLA